MPLATTLTHALLLAQAEGGARGYNLSWAVILASVIIGLVIALRPGKRATTVEKPRRK